MIKHCGKTRQIIFKLNHVIDLYYILNSEQNILNTFFSVYFYLFDYYSD